MRIFSLFFSLLGLLISIHGLAQEDSTAHKKQYLYRVGFDVLKPLQPLSRNYMWLEGQIERINSKNGIMCLELGGGSGTLRNQYLDFSSSGVFFRWGLAQNIIYRAGFKDVETASIGFRYGGAWVRNSQAKYTIYDENYGTSSGIISPRSMYRHWIEINIGMKMQVYNNLYLGWILRGAYKLNSPATNDISPIVIPGFGRGDRSSAVQIGLYLSYLLRK